MTERMRKMIERTLDGSTWSMDEIANAAGISVDTLYAWKTGRRNPSPENLARLADALERRGSELAKLADQLRQEATDG